VKPAIKYVLAATTAGSLGLAIAAAFAHDANQMPGMGMMMHEHRGPMGGPMAMRHGDASFRDDIQLVHAMLADNTKIKRTADSG
jgi:hypothetical protein